MSQVGKFIQQKKNIMNNIELNSFHIKGRVERFSTLVGNHF